MANLYLISQDENTDYDTFDEAVVCADSEHEARNIHPYGLNNPKWDTDAWCETPEDVKVKYLGIADPSIKVGSVVSASFNAG